MKIFTLQMKSINLLAVCLLTSIYSCADKEEDIYALENNISQDIEVSEMSKWLPNSRSVSGDLSDMPVLHFKDEKVYHQTVAKLSEMNAEERDAYFKGLGFEGAYMLWKQADDELEQIFENEDTLQLDRQINEYKIKYERLFSFNTMDEYDVTPYFSFTDEELSLVGNIKGYVVIGNELKTPLNEALDYDYEVEATISTRAAISIENKPKFVPFKKGSYSITNENYKSTMTIGRMSDSNSLAVIFNTKKVAVFWTKRANANYSVNLFFHSAKVKHSKKYKIDCPSGKEIFVLDLPVQDLGNPFDAEVFGFKCSVGKKNGNTFLGNIQVV